MLLLAAVCVVNRLSRRQILPVTLSLMLGNQYRASHLCLTAIACCALALIAACGPVKAPRDAEQPASRGASIELASSTLIPGVVVDPMHDVVYIMRTAGGIESVDVATGGLQWTSAHADQPLFVANGVLFARVATTAPALLLASLDPESGEPTPGAAPPLLTLPLGVVAGIDDTLERTFRHSITASDDEIILSWEFVEREVTGVAPPGGRAFVRRETGAFRYFDGTFEAASPVPTPASTDHWPKELKELFQSKRIRSTPWKTAESLAIAQQYYNPDRLVLRRWRQRDGESLADKTLFDGRALAVLASCDEQYVVVAVPGGNVALEPHYLLRYYALDSGDRVAEVSSWRSAGPFCVLGSRLLNVSQPATQRENGVLIEHPLELVAFDLSSGTEVWRRALRDTAFRGAQPPRN